MQALFEEGFGSGRTYLLLLCLAIAFGFEFVNGFHDTANAVATVIYTNSLKPRIAVLISGACNFTGVFLGGMGVALGIMKLLPVELWYRPAPAAAWPWYVKDARALAVKEGDALALVPTVFTVATEDYPLTRRLYLYSGDDPKNPLASAFIGFAQSDEGQRLVEASGFVSLAVRAETPSIPSGAPELYTKEIAGASRLSLDFRFRPGGVALDTKAIRDVDRLVAFLAAAPNRSRQVLLLGFADDQEQGNGKEALSNRRADAVAALLKQRGVLASVGPGFGSALPVAPNTTPEGRERNRRVEVWIR